MRVWNTATGACLQVVYDHVADVYTVASHPNRPFTYVSCSRDTTLRVWELEVSAQSNPRCDRYRALLRGCESERRWHVMLVWESIVLHHTHLSDFLREECQEKPFLVQATDLKVALSGRASKALMMDCDGIELPNQATPPNLNMARRYQKIY